MPKVWLNGVQYCLVSLVVFAATSALAATYPEAQKHLLHQSEPEQDQRVQAGEVPEGLSGSDWSSIQTQIAAGKYRAYPDQNDGFVSSNPAHGWQIHYAADGTTTLKPRDPAAQAYQLGLKLSAVAFAELQTLGKPQEVTGDGFTVSYQWTDDLREWWVNSESGLEQWFELEQRPAGAANDQALRLELTLVTNLTASQTDNALGFNNAAGTAISYDKLKVWDAVGRELPAQMQLQDNQLSLVFDDARAQYPVTIDPTFRQQAYIKASNPDIGDGFGRVAISGDTLVVGVGPEDSNATGVNGDQSDNSASQSGAAYVFIRSGTTWSQQAYLKASNTESNDLFGNSVGISGDTVVIGAQREDSNATGVDGDQGNGAFTSNSGAAYVFTRSGSVWSQQAYLKASNTGSGDRFGWSVAIASETVVVSSQETSNATGVDGDQSNNSAIQAGAAYVFIRSGTTWSQQAYIKASNTQQVDLFGAAVAIAGNTLVVGAIGEDSNATGVNGDQSNNSASKAGAVYVFTRNGSVWSQQAYLKASNTDANDEFGNPVAISGDTIVVGVSFERSNATGVNGDQGDNSALGAGAAYVFIRSGIVWSQQAYLKASNSESNDRFGGSVGISGDTVVVGATAEDSNATGINGDQSNNSASGAGAAYVFTRSGTVWSQKFYLKASNTQTDDGFGGAAISGDTVVIGASREDSNATGVNGDQIDNSTISAGAVYVFELVRRVMITTE